MPSEAVRRAVGLATVMPERLESTEGISVLSGIQRALDPSKKVERYRRAWRVSKLEVQSGALCGKLGFCRKRTMEETFFDEEAADFVSMEMDSREGVISHFVILPTQQTKAVLAFEQKLPDIRQQSFLGAFKKFLEDEWAGYSVEPMMVELEFRSWLEKMERVIQFQGVFRRPNPQWTPRTEQIRETIEDTGAEQIKLEARVPEYESLKVGSSILGGIVEHAEGGHGKYSARGSRQGGEYLYKAGKAQVIEEISEAPTDGQTDIFRKLLEVVKRVLGASE